MKKLYIIVLVSVIISSCSQRELEYSCDPEINNIVIKNKSAFAQISLNELTTYDLALQKAIFRSWDAEKKRAVWIEKLHHIQNTFQLTVLEFNHIKKLIEHIEIHYFEENKTQDDIYSKDKFADEWINYATNELGWSENFIVFVSFRLYISQDQLNTELDISESNAEPDDINPIPGNCNCNTSADFCKNTSCTPNGCTITSGGCGWLWSDPCNGSC